MIKKIIVNKTSSFNKDFVDYLEQLRILNLVKNKKIIDEITYKKSIVQLNKSHNCN
ncbi:MAG TPA: hypothetical protein IAC20_03970 [Candidatus Faecisoma merdavium]|nr:hypothetical protein [Candidatus Faecisoma merdavium]